MSSALKAVLFDLDGTLVDSRADLVNAVNHVLASLGHSPQPPDTIVSHIGNGLRQLLRDALNIDDNSVLLKAKQLFEDYYSRHYLDETKPYDGVVPTLEWLSGRFKMAVVTNKPYSYANGILNDLSLSRFFGAVIGGDTLAETKPSPLMLNEALALLGSAPSAAMIVGDGRQDLEAGRAARTKTCVVKYGFGFRDNLLNLNPDYVISRFDELKEILT